MILSCKDDYGTIEVEFAGLKCYLCDSASYREFEQIKSYLLRMGDLFVFERFDLDTANAVCSVYVADADTCLPILKFRIKNRLLQYDSNLLRLYNLFATKKARIHI